MTKRRLLAELDSHELTEWIAYEQVHGPLGAARDDFLTALLAAVVANASPNRRKGRPPSTPKDFMPKWDQDQPKQTWQEQLAVVHQLNTALGGKVQSAA